jgi:antitoxin MazE
MKAHLIRIGNSRGVRIPQKVLEHYRIQEGATLELEERQDGILLRPLHGSTTKVSWEQAYREMAEEAAEKAEWLDWDALTGDGTDD